MIKEIDFQVNQRSIDSDLFHKGSRSSSHACRFGDFLVLGDGDKLAIFQTIKSGLREGMSPKAGTWARRARA